MLFRGYLIVNIVKYIDYISLSCYSAFLMHNFVYLFN